jgi:hypothetical protein
MISEFGMDMKGCVLGQSEGTILTLPGWTEEDHKSSKWPIFRPRYEPGTS